MGSGLCGGGTSPTLDKPVTSAGSFTLTRRGHGFLAPVPHPVIGHGLQGNLGTGLRTSLYCLSNFL